MPWVTVSHIKGQRAAGQQETGGLEWSSELMGDQREDEEDAAAEDRQQSLIQTQNEGQPKNNNFWSQTVRTLCCFIPVAAVWFACQLEALPYPSLPAEDMCCRLLLVCFLWALLGGGIYALKCCLRPGQNWEEHPQRKQQLVEPEICRNQYSSQLSRVPPTSIRDVEVPLTQALTDSLLLCVLHEPLQVPSVSHVKALHSRLEVVAYTLEKVNFGPEAMPKEVGRGSMLRDKLKVLCAYLEQRTGSLQALIQVQADFESIVRDFLQGTEGLWAQLVELHAGVTLTKQDSQGNRDLASVQADAESLISVLGQYQNKLKVCQAHLKDSTQLLQELTWSHAHISSKVNGGGESVWPELLLQSNIEQADKVQESFSALEQQIATFKTHLQGLGKEDQEEAAGLLAHTNRSASDPDSLQNSFQIGDLPLRSSTPVASKKPSPISTLKFPSSMRCLPKPGKKK
ncbi:uncharacterized protein si:ch211-151h10.2 isoform X1 [Cyprinodon tularosa]|uniref:uncharacterized protein si:ch211-151h10.2 isoform X1 n=1 Tax=Cyprinodon tularosa TaxID=77115 RepID=UPI0018E1DBC1|nr:uncharacterized protein si:ch211-151h10.2 isoform X1 [Cyprinodon tularosa]